MFHSVYIYHHCISNKRLSFFFLPMGVKHHIQTDKQSTSLIIAVTSIVSELED